MGVTCNFWIFFGNVALVDQERIACPLQQAQATTINVAMYI